MPAINCILCNSTNVSSLESIEAKDIVSLYKDRANVSVARLFKDETISYQSCNDCGLKFYYPQVIGDGEFYNDLQSYKGYYLQEKQEYVEAAKYVKEDDGILEIGAGEGLFTKYIKYKSYIGLEFSDKAIETAGNNGITIISESIQRFSESHANQFDVVCFFQVLEHVQHPRDFLFHSIKCLRPGGRLILAVPSEDSFINEVVNFYLNMPPHHASRWTDKTLRKIGELFDLQLVTLFHENVHQIHQQFYSKTKIYSSIMKSLGKRPRMIDNGITSKLSYGISTAAARIFPRSKDNIGQSVMVVFEKPPFSASL